MVRESKGRSLLENVSDFVVVDVETTGLNPAKDKVIEFGGVRYKDGRISEWINILINPLQHVPSGISRFTGITDEMVGWRLPETYWAPRIYEFIGSSMIVGHNVNFDVNFLYEMFVRVLDEPFRNDFIDTLRIGRKLMPQLEHHTLTDICNQLEVKNHQAHRALFDCYATGECYLKMRHNLHLLY